VSNEKLFPRVDEREGQRKNPAVFIVVTTTGLGGTEVKFTKSEGEDIHPTCTVNTL